MNMTRGRPGRRAALSLALSWALLLSMSPAHAAPLCNSPELGARPDFDPMNDLSGQWVMTQKTVSIADVPVVGEVRSTTRAVVLYRLKHDGDRLYGEGTLCSLSIDSGSTMVRTIIPEAFRKAVERSTLEATLKVEGGQLRLRQGRKWQVVGARLDNPARDALPTGPSDPRVYDQDQDGHPGVTVKVDGLVSGEIYVVQRSWSELEGIQRSSDRFEGYVRFDQEQVILGATKKMLRNPLPSRPDLNRSVFTFERVGDDATCASLR